MQYASAPTEFSTEKFTTIPRVAKSRGVGVRQLRRAAKAGEIPVYPIGGWDRVRESDVDRWIESRRRA